MMASSSSSSSSQPGEQQFFSQAQLFVEDNEYDVLAWHTPFLSCMRYFLDYAQYDMPVQALAAFLNIQLPCQKAMPVLSSSPPNPPAGGVALGGGPGTSAAAAAPAALGGRAGAAGMGDRGGRPHVGVGGRGPPPPMAMGTGVGGAPGMNMGVGMGLDPQEQPYRGPIGMGVGAIGMNMNMNMNVGAGGLNPPEPPMAYVALQPYIRRLVATGFDAPGVLHGFFGDQWEEGVGQLHKVERRNYLFAAKSDTWLTVKAAYDMAEGQTVPFLCPLINVSEDEIKTAEALWSKWLAMQDWMLGPRDPEAGQGSLHTHSQGYGQGHRRSQGHGEGGGSRTAPLAGLGRR